MQDSTPRAILASLAFHALAGGGVLMMRPPPLVVDESSQLIAIELATPMPERPDLRDIPPAVDTPERAPAAVSAPREELASRVKPRRGTALAAIDSSLPGPGAPQEPLKKDARETGELPGATRVDLGIGTYWREVATHFQPAPERPPDESPRPLPAPSPNRILRDGLDEHDHSLGLSHASPLVSAAQQAASPALAPDVGSATLEIEADAAGVLTGARVISASADLSAWNDVAGELVRLMKTRPLHVPHDSRGLRARVRIVAERTLPSGAKAPPVHYETTSDGLPGLAKAFDLSDIGARRSRVVRVELLGEVPL
jgi:hypothetical protein